MGVEFLGGVPDQGASIAEIYCYVAIDKDGNEGICGMFTGMGWMPLVTGSWRICEKLKLHAKEIARASPETKIVLRKFGQAVDLETL